MVSTKRSKRREEEGGQGEASTSAGAAAASMSPLNLDQDNDSSIATTSSPVCSNSSHRERGEGDSNCGSPLEIHTMGYQPPLLSDEEHVTELIWNLKNFWKMRVKEPGDCITSDLYHVLSGCVWTLALYPIGNRRRSERDIEDSNKFLSIYLRLHKSSSVPRANVTFKFYTRSFTSSGRNVDRLLMDSKSAHCFNRDGEENSWGFPKALKRSDLHSHLQDNNSLTIRCVIGFKVSPLTPFGLRTVSRKRARSVSPEESSSSSSSSNSISSSNKPDTEGSNPKLTPMQRTMIKIGFPLLDKRIEVGPNRRGNCSLVTAEGDGASLYTPPSGDYNFSLADDLPNINTVNSIIKLIICDKIEPVPTMEKCLEMAMWCNVLQIKLAERTFYELMAKNFSFDKCLLIVQYSYFGKFDELFRKQVLNYLIKNINQKNSNTTNRNRWNALKREEPSLVADLYEELMEISKICGN